jgi:hypothetical protein
VFSYMCKFSTNRRPQYNRAVAFDSILGGSEDVLADLGVRQALKKIPKGARL